MNTKRVADFWCGGDCEAAKKLPRSLFNEVLAVAIAQDQGRAIEAENDAREREQADKLRAMRQGAV